MNRHERRKAFAQGVAAAKGEAPFPESYIRTCWAMVEALRNYRETFPDAEDMPWPTFRLPHKEIGVAAGIDQVPLICADEAASFWVEAFCKLAETVEPGSIAPTLMQLDYALTEVGVPVERVSPGELGFDGAAKTFTPGEKVRSS